MVGSADSDAQRRGSAVIAAVLEAATAELAAQGFGGFSVEGVANRAGVHKTTVYRRWPDKAELIREALSAMQRQAMALPDTGSIETDLRRLLRDLQAYLWSTHGRSIVRAIIAEQQNPEVANIAKRLKADRMAMLEEMVARAIARKELPRATNPRLVVEPLAATVMHRILFIGERVAHTELDELISVILAGVRAKSEVGRRPRTAPRSGQRMRRTT